jgi:hypothetical protein
MHFRNHGNGRNEDRSVALDEKLSRILSARKGMVDLIGGSLAFLNPLCGAANCLRKRADARR